MRTVRAILFPILLLLLVCGLAWLDVDVPVIAHFSFFWDVILGAALGIALAVLPELSGFAPRKNVLTSMLWICGFVALLLIFYQYMSLVTGIKIEAIAFLSAPGTRMRIAEGTVMGYCSFIAGRGRI